MGLCPLCKEKVSLVFRIINIDLKVSKLAIRYLDPPPKKGGFGDEDRGYRIKSI